jgi:putative transcription factor
MSSYPHQDWKTVLLKPKVDVQTEKKVAHNPVSISSSTGKPAWKVEAQVDSEVGKPITFVSKEDAALIIKARVEKKLTQKELAQKVNMQHKDIVNIESCNAVENKKVLSNIKRVLGIL